MRCARNFSSRQFSFRTPIHLEACVGCNYRLWIEIWCETAWKTSIGKKRLRAQMSMTQKDIDGLIRKTTSRATRKTKRCDGIRGTTKNALESPFRRSTVSTFPSDTAHPTDDWVSIDPRKRLASSINDSSKSDENKKERERERKKGHAKISRYKNTRSWFFTQSPDICWEYNFFTAFRLVLWL